MIELYANMILEILKTKGSLDILEDARYLSFNFNEN